MTCPDCKREIPNDPGGDPWQGHSRACGFFRNQQRMPKPGAPRTCPLCGVLHRGEGPHPRHFVCQDCRRDTDKQMTNCLLVAICVAAGFAWWWLRAR